MKRIIRRTLLVVACAALVAPTLSAVDARADVAPTITESAVPGGFRTIPADGYTPLPVGDPGLAETRNARNLAPGVTVTHIVRGTTPAATDEVNTTLQGPFIVNTVTIDPKIAKGHLQVVHGQYLTDRSTVGQLVEQSGGLVGINASFFDIGDNYGVSDGLAIDNGKLTGNPNGEDKGNGIPNGRTSGPVINSATDKLVLNGDYTWSGTVANLATGKSISLTEIDKKTYLPAECADLPDQTQCAVPGDLVLFDPEWGTTTPTGNGIEVVLDSRGAVVATHTTRGVALEPGQTSIQATGSYAAQLLDVINNAGHIKITRQLFDHGRLVHLTPDTDATTASWVEIDNGANLYPYPGGVDTPTSRNPLTAIATTTGGKIILFTVEGRATFSVGMSYNELAASLINLGAWNAVNLDGGGSTQLFTGGQYLTRSSDGYQNTPSGTIFNGTTRAVGDGIIWVP